MKAIFHIEDMHCLKCSSIILKSIENIEGVSDINVDIDLRKISINLQTKELVENIKEAIEDSGFTLTNVDLL